MARSGATHPTTGGPWQTPKWTIKPKKKRAARQAVATLRWAAFPLTPRDGAVDCGHPPPARGEGDSAAPGLVARGHFVAPRRAAWQTGSKFRFGRPSPRVLVDVQPFARG